MGKQVVILGIESSCDETAAAIVSDGKLLASVIARQDIHCPYGGVVPELASRAHQANIVPTVDAVLNKSGIKTSEISAVGFTRGPGLIGALLVGTSFAKSFSLALNIPLIEVNHIHGHVVSVFLGEADFPEFPYLCLTVSGGHTQIVLVNNFLDVKLLGETIDDAAGEAFDKAAKIMGFPYPGGPLVDEWARKGLPKFRFPVPEVRGHDFSFSGLKTAFLYFVRDRQKKNPKFIEQNLADLCASVQHSIVSILLEKVRKAARETGIRQIAIAGGVAANSGLRSAVAAEGKKHGWKIFIAKFEYCTDNAAMIALAGYYKFLAGKFSEKNVPALARYKI